MGSHRPRALFILVFKLALVAVPLLGTPALAQTGSPTGPPADAPSETSTPEETESPWEWGVDAKLESLYWPQPLGPETVQSLNRLQLIPTLTGKFAKESGADWRVHLKHELFFDPENPSKEERHFSDLTEGYVRASGERFTVQAGRSVVNWGVTDGYNPLDVVNARQYYDPLHSKKLGSLGLLASYATETFEQEIFYIPENRRPMLPGPQSRWLPRQIYIPYSPDTNVELILPQNLRYQYRDLQDPNDAAKNNLAARAQWHFPGIDISVIGYDGIAGFPLIQPEITGTIEQVSPTIVIRTDPDVVLRVRDYRQRIAGYSWVSSQFDFLVKYAASYSVSSLNDPALPGWEHRNIVALEKNFAPFQDIAITAVLQHSFVNTEKSSESNLSVNEIFRRAWMAGFRGTIGELWTVTALALYDSAHGSHFQDFSVARRVRDVWTVQGTSTFISGAPETALGVYDRNDNVTLSLSRSF